MNFSRFINNVMYAIWHKNLWKNVNFFVYRGFYDLAKYSFCIVDEKKMISEINIFALDVGLGALGIS